MSFQFPQNLTEWYLILPALITLLIGGGYFLFPRTMLNAVGLEGTNAHPEAIGEGRSSFAGILMGSAVAVILLQQPILQSMLGLAWAAATIGYTFQFIINKRNDALFLARWLLAFLLCITALHGAGGIGSFTGGSFEIALPVRAIDWLPLLCAIITLGFGILCIISPARALGLMRLQTRKEPPGKYDRCGAEPRGVLAGFYFILGASAFLFGISAQRDVFGVMIFMALGVSWGLIAFGRMISMLSDGSNNGFNWLSLLLELTLSALPLLVIFGLLS